MQQEVQRRNYLRKIIKTFTNQKELFSFKERGMHTGYMTIEGVNGVIFFFCVQSKDYDAAKIPFHAHKEKLRWPYRARFLRCCDKRTARCVAGELGILRGQRGDRSLNPGESWQIPLSPHVERKEYFAGGSFVTPRSSSKLLFFALAKRKKVEAKRSKALSHGCLVHVD